MFSQAAQALLVFVGPMASVARIMLASTPLRLSALVSTLFGHPTHAPPDISPDIKALVVPTSNILIRLLVGFLVFSVKFCVVVVCVGLLLRLFAISCPARRLSFFPNRK